MQDRFASPELFTGDDEESEEEFLADSTLRPLPSLTESLIAYLASWVPPPEQPGLEVDAPSDVEDNLPFSILMALSRVHRLLAPEKRGRLYITGRQATSKKKDHYQVARRSKGTRS